MPKHDLEKLLGGFAADTLTLEEKRQLYSAALQDQELFNSLADEQALKELLADPVVRDRLLRSLRETNSRTEGDSASWLDWFRRPAGLAWTGGLAAAVFAVILGTRIYQDGMKEAGRSVATEETTPAVPPASGPSVTKPATPPVNEPRLNAQDNAKSAATPKKEAPTGKAAKREPRSMTEPEERRARDAATDSPLRQHKKESLQSPAESPRDTLAKSKEEASDSIDQKPMSMPSTSASVPAQTKIPAPTATSGQARSAWSARSVYYGETAEFDAGLMAAEKGASQSAQPLGRLEKKQGQLAASATGKSAASARPLGIRYSVVADRIDGIRRDTGGAADQAGAISLLIEANQEGYLQVWGEAESLQHHLLFPMTEEDPRSSKLIAHQRRTIPIAAEYGTIMLRFSRIPFDSSIKQAATVPNRSSVGLLQESVATDTISGAQGQATYVVNQDPSLSEITIRIPMPHP